MELDNNTNWLARDNNGELWGYELKPHKTDGVWREDKLDTYFVPIDELDNKYSFIKYEDDEPTWVGDLRVRLANVKIIKEYINKDIKTVDGNNCYILKLKDSNLTVQETSVEAKDSEKYILFGESDPSHYSELTTIAIMQEFADVNLVKVEIKQ